MCLRYGGSRVGVLNLKDRIEKENNEGSVRFVLGLLVDSSIRLIFQYLEEIMHDRKNCGSPKVYSFEVSEQQFWHSWERLLRPLVRKLQSCKLWDPRGFYDLAISLLNTCYTQTGADLNIWRPQANKRLSPFPRNITKYFNL